MDMLKLKYDYLNSKEENNLKNYKYSGVDHSFLNKYFYSSIANFCVNNLIPSWMAY